MVTTEPERLVGRAVAALEDAGIPFSFRKGDTLEEVADRAEVDIRFPRSYRREADEALARAGFHLYRARGSGSHRFYLAWGDGRWFKLDAKLEPARKAPAFLRRAARRLLPVRARRSGPVVALVGPDGAGKGTVVEGLRDAIPVGLEVFYLGWRPRKRRGSGTAPAREPGSLRESAFLLKGWAGSLRKLLRAYAAAWRGAIVLCDRHPLEALATRPARTRLGARLQLVLPTSLLPTPDAVVVLDAPAELLVERKGEHSPEVLDRWRHGYREAFGDDAIVSTVGPVEETVGEVGWIVWRALAERRRWRDS